MKLIILLIALLAMGTSVAQADPNIANPPSIGDAPTQTGAPQSPTAQLSPQERTFRGWFGKQFIFLRQTIYPDIEPYQDYADWHIVNPKPSDIANYAVKLPDYHPELSKILGSSPDYSVADAKDYRDALVYEKFVGKVIVCTDFDGNNVIFHVPDYNIDIEYTPTIYSASDWDDDGSSSSRMEHDRDDPSGLTVDNIAPYRELAEGRSLWLGKRIVPQPGAGLEVWDSKTQESWSSDYEAVLDDYLTIVDVIWGDNSDNPLWCIVANPKGKRVGYYDIGVDSLNKKKWRAADYAGLRPISVTFLTQTQYKTKQRQEAQDRAKLHWSDQAWEAIDLNEIYIGMLSAQVKRSIGEPSYINTDYYADGIHQQWVYPHRYVYVDNGKVTAIQTRP